MSLKEEVAEVYKGRPPSKDKKGWIINGLGKEGPEFEELLADPHAHPAALHRVLAKRGFTVGLSTMRGWCEEARA